MSVLIATVALLFTAAPAQAASGPPYDVALTTMAKALKCTGNLATSPQTSVVDDHVGLSASNHGTIDADAPCTLPGLCAASIWQQRSTSAFLKALNTGPETWPGISYTVIRTNLDEIVDHLGMPYDGAAQVAKGLAQSTKLAAGPALKTYAR